MSQQQYSFPILSDKEVSQCLHELGMNASVDQLSKPTFEFVQPIYENLVTALLGVTRCASERASAGGREVAGGRAVGARSRRAARAAAAHREELQQPVFLAIDALEFPELHDESIPALAFIKHLHRLLIASGIKDFSLRVRQPACAGERRLPRGSAADRGNPTSARDPAQ